jgi:hypothetical protein
MKPPASLVFSIVVSTIGCLEGIGVEAMRATQPLMQAPLTTRRWAFALIDTGDGINAPADQLRRELFDASNPTSLRSRYREMSLGRQDIEGDILGPFRHQPTGACDITVATSLRPMVAGSYDHYLWYFGSSQACGWFAQAQLGTPARPAPNSWLNATTTCVPLVQEPLHNFGLMHSSSAACTDAFGAPVPLAGDGGMCAHDENGNPFDPMGTGCFHPNAIHKSTLRWITGCNVVKVRATATFTLFPIEKPCAGVQLLQIPLPAPRATRIGGFNPALTHYYLEMRAPVGLDASLSPRVLVMVGEELAGSQYAESRHWLLDMTPQTPDFSDAGLPPGVTYVDPAPGGPKFTVTSIDAERAVIRVELAASGAGTSEVGVCEDGTSFRAPGPTSCADAPPVGAGGDAGPASDAAPPGIAGPTGVDAGTSPPPGSPDARAPSFTPDPASPDAGLTVAPRAGPYAGPVCRYGRDGSIGWLPLALAASALRAARRRRPGRRRQ